MMVTTTTTATTAMTTTAVMPRPSEKTGTQGKIPTATR